MRIEDAEVVFGKMWSQWSISEREEFVCALTPEEITPPVLPGVLQLAMDYKHALDEQTMQRLVDLFPGCHGVLP